MCLVALVERNRRAGIAVLAGLLAALPAPLLGGAPLQAQMAFSLNGNDVPPEQSWTFIVEHYLPAVRGMIEQDLPPHSGQLAAAAIAIVSALLVRSASTVAGRRIRRGILVGAVACLTFIQFGLLPGHEVPYGILLLTGMMLFFLQSSEGDRFVRFHRGAALVACAYLLVLPQYSGFRYELVLLPFAAIGFAWALNRSFEPSRVTPDLDKPLADTPAVLA
jgi:hypothetical protein